METGAGVKRYADNAPRTPAQLDGQVPRDHVLCRLGCAAGLPAPQAVVANATDPGGEAREYYAILPGQQALEVLGDQQWTDRVDREAPLEARGRHIGEPFLGLHAGAVVEQACAVDE